MKHGTDLYWVTHIKNQENPINTCLDMHTQGICVLQLLKEAKFKLLKAMWLEPTLLFPRSHQIAPMRYQRSQSQEFSQRVWSFGHPIGHSYSQ
ncbi:hypothetical protein Hanom_Chr13g01236221 [Helianthus anomalus]